MSNPLYVKPPRLLLVFINVQVRSNEQFSLRQFLCCQASQPGKPYLSEWKTPITRQNEQTDSANTCPGLNNIKESGDGEIYAPIRSIMALAHVGTLPTVVVKTGS